MSLPTNTNIWTIFRNTHISLAKKFRTVTDLVKVVYKHFSWNSAYGMCRANVIIPDKNLPSLCLLMSTMVI